MSNPLHTDCPYAATRMVQMVRQIEIQDECVRHWTIFDEDDLTALELLAFADTDCDLSLASFRCMKHKHVFCVTDKCPGHKRDVTVGERVSVPLHVAGALIARGDAAGLSLESGTKHIAEVIQDFGDQL